MKNKNLETWKPVGIEQFSKYFEVSNIGRVRRILFTHPSQKEFPAIVKQHAGYMYVMLAQDGKHKCVRVHRLVAMAFIPNTNNYPEVNHKDGDKTNNSADNLEWCTRSENERHKYDALGYTHEGRTLADETKRKISDSLKSYNSEHPRAKIETSWAERNAEHLRQYRKEYYKKNKEKIDAKNKAYQKAHPKPRVEKHASGWKWSEESRQRMSERQRGQKRGHYAKKDIQTNSAAI